MRVFLADAEPEVRAALQILLDQEPDLHVVGQARRARDLVERVRASHADLVVVDWHLPGGRMSDLLPALRSTNGVGRVIALGIQPEAERAALAAGADAFVSKTDPPEQLLAALRHDSGLHREAGLDRAEIAPAGDPGPD
jgi:DNA-binding NarL/FixJ family response regulator